MMKLKPAGYFVLIEVAPVDEYHDGGVIKMVSNEAQREHGGRDVGIVIEFGPIAYKGYSNCEKPSDWCEGLKVGSKVEFNRYDGKTPRAAELNEDFRNYRIINDSDIIAVLSDE